jgi:cytoplasmic iron level regulating protein YaaA (DUF328/UPF0246 family)
MLILLPPSETKRPGGRSSRLDLGRLALPTLAPQRERAVDALVELSGDPAEAARVLGLGPRQLDEIEVNAHLRTAPTMAAIDRYTGVLYDALGADTLDTAARRWLGANVMIHSAPFGPVGALDPIPAYRLGAAASIPSLGPLRRHWAAAVTVALEASDASFVLDLRSEAYLGLGPVPDSIRHAYVRVVTRNADGEVRALNHFNKHAKGDLVRRLAQERPRVRTGDALLRWAAGSGVDLISGPADTFVLAV